MDEPGWAPAGVDTRRANMARVYDYLLGGSHNYLADQDAGRAIASRAQARDRPRQPRVPGPGGAVPAEAGIRQFLDIGSGIPTQGNVHEVAQQADPAPGSSTSTWTRSPSRTAGPSWPGNEHAAIIEADLRDPGDPGPPRHPATDRPQPAGRAAARRRPAFPRRRRQPRHIVATLRDALAPGSYLVLCHATDEAKPAVARATEKVYSRGVAAHAKLRSRAEIRRFFDGFELSSRG